MKPFEDLKTNTLKQINEEKDEEKKQADLEEAEKLFQKYKNQLGALNMRQQQEIDRAMLASNRAMRAIKRGAKSIETKVLYTSKPDDAEAKKQLGCDQIGMAVSKDKIDKNKFDGPFQEIREVAGENQRYTIGVNQQGKIQFNFSLDEKLTNKTIEAMLLNYKELAIEKGSLLSNPLILQPFDMPKNTNEMTPDRVRSIQKEHQATRLQILKTAYKLGIPTAPHESDLVEMRNPKSKHGKKLIKLFNEIKRKGVQARAAEKPKPEPGAEKSPVSTIEQKPVEPESKITLSS